MSNGTVETRRRPEKRRLTARGTVRMIRPTPTQPEPPVPSPPMRTPDARDPISTTTRKDLNEWC